MGMSGRVPGGEQGLLHLGWPRVPVLPSAPRPCPACGRPGSVPHRPAARASWHWPPAGMPSLGEGQPRTVLAGRRSLLGGRASTCACLAGRAIAGLLALITVNMLLPSGVSSHTCQPRLSHLHSVLRGQRCEGATHGLPAVSGSPRAEVLGGNGLPFHHGGCFGCRSWPQAPGPGLGGGCSPVLGAGPGAVWEYSVLAVAFSRGGPSWRARQLYLFSVLTWEEIFFRCQCSFQKFLA